MDEPEEIVVEVAGVDAKDYHLVAALDRAAKATFGPLASKYTSRLQKHLSTVWPILLRLIS